METESTPTVQAGRHKPALVVFLATAAVLLGADLLVKQLAFAHVAGEPVVLERDEAGVLPALPRHEGRLLISNVLALHLTANEGAVFGVGQGGRWFFVVVSLVAIVVIVSVFWRSPADSPVLHAALGSVLAGALGNLYDRIVLTYVRDMLWLFPDVHLPMGWTWPGGSRQLYPWIFNIADVALIAGIITLLFMMFRHERKARA